MAYRADERLCGAGDETYVPSAAVADFLQTGPAPLYIGFGSMTIEDPEVRCCPCYSCHLNHVFLSCLLVQNPPHLTGLLQKYVCWYARPGCRVLNGIAYCRITQSSCLICYEPLETLCAKAGMLHAELDKDSFCCH